MFYFSDLFFILSSYKLSINIWAFEFTKIIANPILNTFMHLLASSFFIILPAIVLYLYFIKKDRNAYVFVVAIIFFFIVSDIIKNIIRMPRPCHVSSLNWINTVGCENSFSFPSNHATVLTGLGFFLKNYKYLCFH